MLLTCLKTDHCLLIMTGWSGQHRYFPESLGGSIVLINVSVAAKLMKEAIGDRFHAVVSLLHSIARRALDQLNDS